jgi:type IV fimbrial biogenesis protein FimT
MQSLHRPLSLQRGFTLVEAITVLSIMAILAGVSAPSFVWLNQATQIRGATFDLVADLDFARSEAVKRNDDVVVAPRNGDWTNGWTVTTGGNTLRQRDAVTGQVDFAAAPAALTFDGARPGQARHRQFPDLPAQRGSVVGRTVRIDPSGLSRSTKSACST